VTAARRTDAWNAAILVSFAAITVLPIVGIVLLSLQSGHGPVSGFELPDRLHFENYARAFEAAHFASYLKSSLIVSSAVVAGTVVVSTLAGYAFGTMRFAGENFLFYLLLTGLLIPFEAVIVPLYVELRAGNLTNTYWSVILPLIGVNSAFGTFWMRAYFRSVPRQLLEAGAMDGAGSFRILWQVLLPGARPALLTLVVLVFMWSWNEFLLPLVMLSREDLRTAPLGLAFFAGRYTMDLVGMAAAAVMVALPVVVLFVATHRRFVHGMWVGALKQ
jgi:raffinose/stachyose/melibiose transport system permease protein